MSTKYLFIRVIVVLIASFSLEHSMISLLANENIFYIYMLTFGATVIILEKYFNNSKKEFYAMYRMLFKGTYLCYKTFD